MRKRRCAAWRGSVCPFVAFLGLLQPPHQLIRPEPCPGQHLPDHPVNLRPGDLGHLFPPILLQTQQKRSAQQAEGHVVMPARPGAGLVLIQPHIVFSVSNSVSMRHRDPPT